MSLKDQILSALCSTPGLTDRELTDRVFGPGVGQQPTNQAARALAVAGRVVRRKRHDGKIGNYLSDAVVEAEPQLPRTSQSKMLSEDDVKRVLQGWLESTGWQVEYYREKVLPRLSELTIKRIRTAMDVSHPYAAMIRKGIKVPHPRHWVALAKLAGILSNS